MENPHFFSFSNRLEALFQQLKFHLYENRKSPFEKIIIVVPSRSMKTWLMRQCAFDPDLNIAFGFQILLIHEAIDWLLKNRMKVKKIPTEWELCLAIYAELNVSKNKASLAMQLAKAYLELSEYAPDELLTWQQHPGSAWQKQIWQNIFKKNTHWQPSYLAYQTADLIENLGLLQIHFFGISYLSKQKFQFFNRFHEHAMLYHWILSPCRLFWSDLKNEREQSRLLKHFEKKEVNSKQLETLEELFKDNNVLLANNGKLGQEWFQQLEEIPSVTIENYFISDKAFSHPKYEPLIFEGIHCFPSKHLSLLHAVQADLTLLHSFEEEIEIKETHPSIEIHQAPTLIREVEILYQTLLKTAFEQKIQPGQIVVMVSNLELYRPFIKMIFENQDSQLPIEIDDISMLSQSPYIKAFMCLLHLVDSYWTLDEVFEVAKNPYFSRKGTFTLEEMDELYDLFANEKVHWGFNANERQSLLESQPLSEKSARGTWEGGFKTLLKSFSQTKNLEEYLTIENEEYIPNGSVNFSQAEVLGKWFNYFKELKKDLSLSALEQSFFDWQKTLIHLLEKYLEPTCDKSIEDSMSLKRVFQKLHHGAIADFKTIKTFLKKLISETSYQNHENHLQAIRFCSLLPMRSIPAEVIVWMGLNEDCIPRKHQNPINFFENIKLPYIPRAGDYDRYLFLESLLSARTKFILSFTRSPSSILQEFQTYLDRHYLQSSQKIFFNHPSFNFNEEYFVNSSFTNYSPKDYQLAKLLQNPPVKLAKTAFIPPLPIEGFNKEKFPHHLTLNQLKNFFFHPIKHYVNQSLGVYFEEKLLRKTSLAEFEESDYLFTYLTRLALRYPLEKVFSYAERSGKFPVEPFKKVSKNRLRKQIEERLQALEQLQIAPEHVFEIEFSHGCRAIEKISDYQFKIPPIIKAYQNKKVWITGKLPFVCPKGLISFRSQRIDQFLISLPDMLFLNELPVDLTSPHIHIIQLGKSICTSELNDWTPIFDAYFRSLHQPLPFMPGWVDPLLEGDKNKLNKAMQLSISNPFLAHQDKYLQWGMGLHESECAWIEDWKAEAHKIFGTAKDVWEKA